MSRLIFEGETRERFGEYYPKPFIEQVRIFESDIQADIALYFEIEENESLEIATFLQQTGLEGLRIHLQLRREDQFNSYFDGQASLTALLSNDSGAVETGQITLGQFTDFEISYFYNSEGKKFIKFFKTFTLEDYRSRSGFSSQAMFLYCITFFDFKELPATNPAQFKTQYSEISYEKVLNSDGSVNIERIVVYLESNGNYYSKTPLMSLDRQYRKVDNINNLQVLSRIQRTVAPYLENIAEADLVLSTAQQNLQSPRLLLLLQRNINNFSEKSTSTTTGTLYGLLVDQVVEIDGLLTASESLQKRLETNIKVKDLRGTYAIPNTSNIITRPTQDLDFNSPLKNFVSIEFFSRNIFPRAASTAYNRQEGATSRDDLVVYGFSSDEGGWVVSNELYVLIDYEKLLNYKSRISTWFNPYNLLQLFGNNCLNQYFQFEKVQLSKYNLIDSVGNRTIEFDLYNKFEDEVYDPALTDLTDPAVAGGDEESVPDEYGDNRSYFEPINLNEHIPAIDVETAGPGLPSKEKRLFSYMCERAFEPVVSSPNYRLKCFEAQHIESVSKALRPAEYGLKVDINDLTLEFYDKEIRQKMFDLKNQLKEYYDFANQFCSYNNLDNVFNSFFVEAMEEQFSEPYVWTQAPIYFISIGQLILASYELGEIGGPRKKDGTLINMEEVKIFAQRLSMIISPSTGNLLDLEQFYNDYNSFFEDFIDYDVWDGRIYTVDYYTEAAWDFRYEGDTNYEAEFPIRTSIVDSFEIIDVETDAVGEIFDDGRLRERVSWSADSLVMPSTMSPGQIEDTILTPFPYVLPEDGSDLSGFINDQYLTWEDTFSLYADLVNDTAAPYDELTNGAGISLYVDQSDEEKSREQIINYLKKMIPIVEFSDVIWGLKLSMRDIAEQADELRYYISTDTERESDDSADTDET